MFDTQSCFYSAIGAKHSINNVMQKSENSTSGSSISFTANGKANGSSEPESNSLDTMINFISEGIFIVDIHGQIKMINPVAARLFGATRDELIGQSLLSYMHDGQLDEYRALFESLQNNPKLALNHGPKEIKIHRVDGKGLDADLSLSCLPKIFTGHDLMLIGVIHDLTSHKAEYGKLRRLARTDFLTSLANRHAFEETLDSDWKECLHNDMPLSLMLIDVDYFKQFNDLHGHINGDKCLQKIAQTIASCLPSRDCLAARYGGEEFAVIMPRCNNQIAQLVAIRIKRQIQELSFEDLGLDKSVKVTVSLGLTCQQGNLYHTPESLLCSADVALYRAKANGRNSICSI